MNEHDKLVTSIDWAPNTNRLLTCSQDRNAYVWTLDASSNTWKPVLVLLRINRAATAAKWSPQENKFAVASGAKTISVCYFEQENDWWVSKHITKPICSTVLSLDWHPNNSILAAGSADNRVRVFGAAIKSVDSKQPSTVWGDKYQFKSLLAEYQSNGWVHSVAFSPSGNSLAWTSHDSTVNVVYPGPSPVVSTVSGTNLPFTSVLYLNETALITAGYDCFPMLFKQKSLSSQEWGSGESIDTGKQAKASTISNSSAFNKFRQMDTRAQTSTTGIELNSQHQNTINCLRPYKLNGNSITSFTTSGIDGKLVIWNMLEASVGGLSLN